MGTAAGKVVIGGGSTSSGTVSLVESTDGSVTVTGGSGPTVNLSVPASSGGIDQLTGDVTAGPGTGSQAATLATVATAQTTGDASHTPTITIDAKGRVTTLVNNLISITVSQISNFTATLAGYLQLAGGTMTGTLNMGAPPPILSRKADHSTNLCNPGNNPNLLGAGRFSFSSSLGGKGNATCPEKGSTPSLLYSICRGGSIDISCPPPPVFDSV